MNGCEGMTQIELRLPQKRLWMLFVLACFAFWLSLRTGAMAMESGALWRGFTEGPAGAYYLLVMQIRLPRTLLAALLGMSLSLAGCILQALMHNVLASPSTIGVTSGASFVGFLCLVAFPQYFYLLPVGTILGAFGTTLLIYFLAYRRGVSPSKMILSGLAVSALFGAFNDMIRLLFADRVQNIQGFLVGGLNGAGMRELKLLLPFAILGLSLSFFLPVRLNILALGDELARGLGLRVEGFRFFLIALASLLAGASVAVAGLMSFVGLIVPHMARLLLGADHRVLLPGAALLGVSFVCLCDAIGRVMILPAEMPVTVIIAVLGAPFFLSLLRKGDA